MAIVRWMAVAVAAVIAILSFTACTGDGDTPMQATLTNDGCGYRGDTKAEAGRFTIEVKNETPQGANFALLRLADGYTASTIRPILAKETAWVHSLSNSELRRIQEGQRPLRHCRRSSTHSTVDLPPKSGSAAVACCRALERRPATTP
jgi:hypothetical protein